MVTMTEYKMVGLNGEMGTAEIGTDRVRWHRPMKEVVLLLDEVVAVSDTFKNVGWRTVSVQLRSGAIHKFMVRKKHASDFKRAIGRGE